MFAPKTEFPSFGAALPFPSSIITNYCFSAFKKKCLNQAVRLQQSIPHSLTTASRSVVMFAPKTKFLIFSAALPFPNTIITNYCFSAILKGLKLSSSSTAINLLRSILVPLQRSIPHSSATASSFVVMFAPKTKFTSFGAALPFPNTIITNYCFSAILKGLKLSSSSSAVNTSQFGQLSVVLLSCLPRKQSFRVLAPLYPFQIQILQTIAFLQF